MTEKQRYRWIYILREIGKYSLLFMLCYTLLFLELNFFLVLPMIIGINVIFIKLELRYHLATQMARLIRKEKYQQALQLGILKNAESRDDYSRLLMLAAYNKTGNRGKALDILKSIDNQKWKTKKVRKIVNNWKVKILLNSQYQLN